MVSDNFDRSTQMRSVWIRKVESRVLWLISRERTRHTNHDVAQSIGSIKAVLLESRIYWTSLYVSIFLGYSNCRTNCWVMAGICLFTSLFHANSDIWAKKTLPLREVWSGKFKPGLDSFAQINKSIDGPGEARQSGNTLSAAITPFLSKWARIALIIASIQDPIVIKKTLTHLNEKLSSVGLKPSFALARGDRPVSRA